ncbi:MAG: hypothetical protein M2R45_04969 [Verrucomicrobia subdivision 3 bacterium]|nr:hypothetical protein [Limisphaerales bacterium]MCS1414084.1 hypothetical protein [Limisphaerales bacterium]
MGAIAISTVTVRNTSEKVLRCVNARLSWRFLFSRIGIGRGIRDGLQPDVHSAVKGLDAFNGGILVCHRSGSCESEWMELHELTIRVTAGDAVVVPLELLNRAEERSGFSRRAGIDCSHFAFGG